MQPVELFQAAQARAAERPLPTDLAHASEVLRAETQLLLGRLPEPPTYRRADDPVRKAATDLLPAAEALLTQGLVLIRSPEVSAPLRLTLDLLHALVEVVAHTADGRLSLADEAWQRARALEEAQHPTRKFLSKPPGKRPAYERQTGASRYDPAPEPAISVKLVCPNTGCKKTGDYGFQSSHATHQFQCAVCKSPFVGYFGELRAVQVDVLRSSRRYHFMVHEVGEGVGAQVDFEEASGADFSAAPRDLLAFLYTEARELKSVMNLTNHRMLWVSPAKSCFVATVAFGAGAPELRAFRDFRDDFLRKFWAGRAFIRAYYRHGERLAQAVERRPFLKRAVRQGLVELHRHLPRRRFP